MLAGGSSSRLGMPKQFLELGAGRRLVDVAVAVARDVADEVVLVLPSGVTWEGATVDRVARAGAHRIISVANALAHVDGTADVVLVHDAAHPLVSSALARSVVEAVRAGAQAAIPLLRATDVVKRVRADGSLETVGRDDLGMGQVPHAFSRAALVAAHAGCPPADVWEDSELIERCGGRVVAVPGDPGEHSCSHVGRSRTGAHAFQSAS